jgi:hypothetical protein
MINILTEVKSGTVGGNSSDLVCTRNEKTLSSMDMAETSGGFDWEAVEAIKVNRKILMRPRPSSRLPADWQSKKRKTLPMEAHDNTRSQQQGDPRQVEGGNQ